MTKEFKFIALSDAGVHFKAGDNGPGLLLGYAAVTGNLDEGGDIILPGAFEDTIDTFLKSGFTAQSHDWSVDGVIGYPVKAYEDATGLYVESKFHSTADAQAVRTKAQERMADGLEVGLSIGYEIAAAPKYLFPKEYETELPKYVKSEHLAEAQAKAPRFSKIRLLSKLNNFEHSIVTAQMNKLAIATSVKSAATGDAKGIFEDACAEDLSDPWYLFQKFMGIYRQLRFAASQTETTVDDATAQEAVNEFSARLLAALQMPPDTDDAYYGYWYDGRSESLTKILGVKDESESDSSFDEHSAKVASALKEFAQIGAALNEPLSGWIESCKKRHDIRTKVGRTISAATATKLESAVSEIDVAIPAMENARTAMSDLLDVVAPKEITAVVDTAALAADFLRANFHRIGVENHGTN